jgi:hypothetical protein
LLLLSGCTGGTTKTVGKDVSFIGGTSGLVIGFEEGLPPDTVFDGGTYAFDVSVRLENVGETDVQPSNVVVELSGINPAEFGLSEGDFRKNPNEPVLRTYKDSDGNIIDGSVVNVDFTGLNYARTLVGPQSFPIRAEVCYLYESKATAMLCVTNDLFDQTQNRVCKVNEDKTISSSGAPVQVSKFKESARGQNKVSFSFDIELRANGELFRRSTGCDYTVRDTKNKVWVTVDSRMPGLVCSGLASGTSGELLLSKGKRTITCTQDVNTNIDYEQPVDITVQYDYLDYKETTIVVNHEG